MVLLSAILLSMGSVISAGGVTEAKQALQDWHAALSIDRPWDELPDASEDTKRLRGAMAYVYHKMEGGEISEKTLLNLYRDLGSLLAIEDEDQLLKAKPAFSDYQGFFEINIISLWKRLITRHSSPIRWNSKFKEAYYSRAESTGVLFDVRLPLAVKDRKTYPLLVVLNRGPTVKRSSDFPFIQVTPSGRGVWGYRAISAFDAMQVIDFMKRYYPVDPDRVYLTGFSAGASAAMHLSSSYPDKFAAVLPLVAFGTHLPLRNLRNLPIAIHHGTDDWTSSICNVRVQYELLRRLGCPAVLREYPGKGHTVPGPHDPLLEWLLKQKRKRSPSTVTHQCETPDLGRAYWAQIHEFIDPHQCGSIKAAKDSSAGQSIVRIQSTNVLAFSLDLDRISRSGVIIEHIEIDDTLLSTENQTGQVYFRILDDQWALVSPGDDLEGSMRPYRAGAAANLYQGEPLLIVYGTQSDQPDRIDQLLQAARNLATCGGPTYAPMRGHFPVVADSALTPDQEANCNLILLGTPDENSLTKTILPDLPIRLRNDMLEVADRPSLPLRSQILSLLYPHPKHPKRLVYIIAPFTDVSDLKRFSQAPQRFLAGSEGFDRVSQADLLVQNLDRQIGREMQFGKRWEWLTLPGSETPIPNRFRHRSNLAISYMRAMQRKSGADFALWWGPADTGMWGYDFNYLESYNPDTYVQADFHTNHREVETMTGGVTGAELKDIWDRWGRNQEILSVPELDTGGLVDQREYRLNIPMDMYIKLGTRERTLNNPKPGPTISVAEVQAEVFQGTS